MLLLAHKKRCAKRSIHVYKSRKCRLKVRQFLKKNPCWFWFWNLLSKTFPQGWYVDDFYKIFLGWWLLQLSFCIDKQTVWAVKQWLSTARKPRTGRNRTGICRSGSRLQQFLQGKTDFSSVTELIHITYRKNRAKNSIYKYCCKSPFPSRRTSNSPEVQSTTVEAIFSP